MAEVSFVVVFPSIFAKNKIPSLITNIKKILKIRNQKFNSVKREEDIIIVDANDPVFASSAINLLFGIEKVAIARKVTADFDGLVDEITKLGGNLLLKGERFHVRAEGKPEGFTAKDLEVAATSSIIDKKSNLGARPGSEQSYDKLIYTYITKKNAYVCIFLDKGHEGVPYGFNKKDALCCIYDELSAVSCLQTIKEGFSVSIIVCYRSRADLTKLAKILDRILPVILTETIHMDFYKLSFKPAQSYQKLLALIIEILVDAAKASGTKHISLPISPMIFPVSYAEYALQRIFGEKIIPVFSLHGMGKEIFQDAIELGLEKYLNSIESLIKRRFDKISQPRTSEVQASLKTKKTIRVYIGPNNVHDILDSLEE